MNEDIFEKEVRNKILEWNSISSNQVRNDWEFELTNLLYSQRHNYIGNLLYEIIDLLRYNDTLWCGPIPGAPCPENLYNDRLTYKSFMDYFTRKLNTETHNRIYQKTRDSIMIIPNECEVMDIGSLEDSSKIVSLKKGSVDFINHLKKIGLKTEGYNYINMRLLLTYYHRIHSPIKGKIERIISVPKEDDLFGNNYLSIIDILTSNGNVYLMVIGEANIQDFQFEIKVGQEIDTFDELGHFDWGSQTIIVYPQNFGDLKIKEKTHYFVGDNIF